MMRATGFPLLALVLTAAPAVADVNGIPQAIYDHTLDRFLAEQIGTVCPQFSFDRDRADMDSKLVEASSGLDTATLEGLASQLPMDRLASDLAALYAAKNIVQTDPATFCAAGRAEVAAGSAIGSYLKAK